MFDKGFDYSKAQEPGKFRLKSKFGRVAVNLLVTVIVGFLYFYFSLPATWINFILMVTSWVLGGNGAPRPAF